MSERTTLRLSAASVIAGDLIESLDGRGGKFPVLDKATERSTTGAHTVMLRLEMPSRSKQWVAYDPENEFIVHRESHRLTAKR